MQAEQNQKNIKKEQKSVEGTEEPNVSEAETNYNWLYNY